MENKLEFLGREGLTTLLTQVNENTTKKLDKAPNGTSDLITGENKIDLDYLPSELVRGENLIYGGYINSSDEFFPTVEATNAFGMLSSDSEEIQGDGGYVFYDTFSVYTYGQNYNYPDVIKEGFYFDKDVEGVGAVKVARVGNQWQNVDTPKRIEVVNTINGQSGDVEISSFTYGGNLEYWADMCNYFGYWHTPSLDGSTNYSICEESPMWIEYDDHDGEPTKIPEGTFFIFTSGYNLCEDEETGETTFPPIVNTTFAGHYITLGDILYVKNGVWEKIDSGSSGLYNYIIGKITESSEKFDEKLNKKPDGENDLITSENKIDPSYLPNELVHSESLVYGGSLCYYSDDQFELYPTQEALDAGGFYDYQCMAYGDFRVECEYYEYYDEPIVFHDAIKEGFYFEASGGGSFGGIQIPEEGSIYIKRVGDQWKKTQPTESKIVVVNTINDKSGDVILTAEDISVPDTDKNIKEALEEISDSLTSAETEVRDIVTQLWNNKLDKITPPFDDSYTRIYAVDSSGYQQGIVMRQAVVPLAIVQRDAAGKIQSDTPTKDVHTANKGYVDEVIQQATESVTTALNSVSQATSNKLDKKPDGAENLITEENVISLNYMPKEMVSSLVYGGDMYVYSNDNAEFGPTEEAVLAGGFLSPDTEEVSNNGGYRIYPDFSINTWGGEPSYSDVIREGFYFKLYSTDFESGYAEEYTWDGIVLNAAKPECYVKRVGNHWEEVTNIDEKFVSLVTSVNGQKGAVVLTGDSIQTKEGITVDQKLISVDSAIKNKLDKAPNGSSNLLDENNKINTDYLSDVILGQLKFGGTLYYDGEAEDFVADIDGNTSSSHWFVTPSSLLTSSIDFENSAYGNANGGIPVFDGNPCIIRTEDYSYSDYGEVFVNVSMSAIPEGFYFIFSDGFNSEGSETFNLAGIDFEVGDWALVTNGQWKKVDNTDAVRMVNGKIGNVVLTGEDIAISTDNNTTVKEYVDSKQDKDTTYTIEHNPVDPLKLYLKGSDSSSKVVDLRRTAYVGNSTGTAATGYYKFLSGKLGTSQDANLLLYIDKTITNTASGLLHVHLRKATSGFSQTDVSWLTRRTNMPEDVIGLIANNETGEYALYLYCDGTYNACRVEVLYNAGSMIRDNAYTLHETKTPDDIDTSLLIYSQDNAIVSRATKDGNGNNIVKTYKKNTYDGVVKSTGSTYGNYYTLLMEVELPNNAHYPEFTSRFNICDIESSSCFSGTFCWYVKRGGGTDGSGTISQHVRWESLTRPTSYNRLVSTYEVGENSVICRLYYQNHGTWVSLAFSRYDARITGVNILTDVIGANTSENRFYETISGTQVTSTGPYAVYDENGKRFVDNYYSATTSRTANTFLAAPSGSNGAATFRKITGKDLPRYIHLTGGDQANITTAGYAKIARITVKNTYQSGLITMDVIRRNTQYPCSLSFVFESVDSMDPNIRYFRYSGEDYGAFLHKAETSVWDLYIKKTERYDSIAVTNYSKIAADSDLEIAWITSAGCAEKLDGAIEPTYYNNIDDYYTNAPITYSSSMTGNIGKYVKLLEVDAEYTVRSSGIYAIQDRETNFAGIFYFNFIGDSATYYNAGVKWLDVTADPTYISENMPLIATAEPYEGGTKFRIYFQPFKNYLSLVLTPLSFHTSDVSKFKYITPKSGYRVFSEYVSDTYDGTLKSKSNRPYSIEYDAAGQKITETYIKDIAVEESTLTYTKGDGTTQSVELQTVNSINGLNGDVTLTGSDISISNDDGTSIKDYVDNVVSGGGDTNLSDLYWGESDLEDHGYYGTESQTIGSIHDSDYNVNIDISAPMPTLTTLLCRAHWQALYEGRTLNDNAIRIFTSNPYGMILQYQDDVMARHTVSSVEHYPENTCYRYTFSNGAYAEIDESTCKVTTLTDNGNPTGTLYVCY